MSKARVRGVAALLDLVKRRRGRVVAGMCIGVAVLGIAGGTVVGLTRGQPTTRVLGASHETGQVADTTAPAETPSGTGGITPVATPGATPGPTPGATRGLTNTAAPASQRTAPTASPAPAPIASLDLSAMDFGSENVGENNGTHYVNLRNSGGPPLHVVAASAGGPFQVVASPCVGATLTQGQNCPIGIEFQPTDTGPVSATLTVTDDSSPPTQTMSLSGVGTEAGMSLSQTSLAFRGRGGSAQTVTMTSTGSGDLNVLFMLFDKSTPNFAVIADSCVGGHPPGTQCTFQVEATPPAGASAYSATLLIYDDATGNAPQTISLSWRP